MHLKISFLGWQKCRIYRDCVQFTHKCGLDEEMQMPSTKSLWCAWCMRGGKNESWQKNWINWKLSINLCDLFEWRWFFSLRQMHIFMQSKMNFTCSRTILRKLKTKWECGKKWRRTNKLCTCTFNTEKILNSYFTNEEAANFTPALFSE